MPGQKLGVFQSIQTTLCLHKYVLIMFFEQNKPKTVYEVSQLGREEFLRYLANLKQILLHTQME